ncbi:hypothetical protein MXMO3_02870 [Maritalea myrionectae]|uniref:Uncharacterized protein n=1 Tax=Maritalea myrionectae TaxID=454601 RepID=A0A2R4MHB9_9HYPH|nr:hypothetical protein MXMO3_02870 [Maritalea myrionectae]
MTTFLLRTKKHKDRFNFQKLIRNCEIDFHKLGVKLQNSLENLHYLVQCTKINFIEDREGSYDL